jgi:hypothetical protein
MCRGSGHAAPGLERLARTADGIRLVVARARRGAVRSHDDAGPGAKSARLARIPCATELDSGSGLIR